MSEKIIESICENSSLRREFLQNLCKDLEDIQITTSLIFGKSTIKFKAKLPGRTEDLHKKILAVSKVRQLESEKEFIQGFLKNELMNTFLDGCDMDLQRISPVIRICESYTDLKMFRFGRLLQSVSGKERPGRRIKALVFDEGQSKNVLMGAIGLSSSLYSSKARDDLLLWGNQNIERRHLGLRRVMDLSTCISFPPYSYLMGGKLMAMLATSSGIANHYLSKYGDPLLAVFTNCTSGLHCPIFNRIMIVPGGLYKRIGKTSGMTISHFSDAAIKSGELLSHNGSMHDSRTFPTSNALTNIKRALNACNLPYRPFLVLSVDKGQYMGLRQKEDLDVLRAGRGDYGLPLSSAKAIDYWKNNMLSKKKVLKAVVEKARGFRINSLNPGRT